MLVGVDRRSVRVRVLVDEIHRAQQRRSASTSLRSALGDDAVLLGEHDAAIGEQVERARGRGSRARSSCPPGCSSTMSSSSHCCVRGSSAAVGSSKSSTSGFITSTDAIATRFFCPPESWYGARSARSRDRRASRACRRRGARPRSSSRPMFERPERDLVAHGRGEHLRVGVLEHEADARPEAARELLVLEAILGHLASEARGTSPVSGKSSPSRSLSSVDFPQPFAPSSASFSPALDRERHAVERDEAVEVAVAHVVDREQGSRHVVDHRATRSTPIASTTAPTRNGIRTRRRPRGPGRVGRVPQRRRV